MAGAKLYYVLGQLVYALARAEESIDKTDRLELHDLFVSEFGDCKSGVDLSEVISHILNKEKKDFETTYNWVIQSLKLQQSELDQEMKSKILNVAALVVDKYPSKSFSGDDLLARLKTDVQEL